MAVAAAQQAQTSISEIAQDGAEAGSDLSSDLPETVTVQQGEEQTKSISNEVIQADAQ